MKVRHSRKTVSNNDKWICILTRLSDSLLKLELAKIWTPRRRKNWADELWKVATANISLHLVLAQKSELRLNDYDFFPQAKKILGWIRHWVTVKVHHLSEMS